ncbi:MAG TPA: enoyl-CoA hydratase-related protein, partial [Burkholderiaceae bacterium]
MADTDTDTGTRSALRVEVGADGIAVATMDSPGRSMNVLDDTLAEPLTALVGRLEADAAIKGLVVTTGKRDFLAGADVERLAALATAQEAFDESMRFKAVLRRLERAGKPVVAAIRGKCLGGGL